MKRLTNGLIAIGMAFSAIAATPTITGVTAQQRYPWNGKVDISYTVTGDIAAEAKERGLLTSLKVTATDRDANTTYTATSLSGDKTLAAGTHSIVWDMDAQGLSFKSSNVVFSVACEATPALYCVIDLSAGANASSYPVTYLAAPPSGGFNVDTYKTAKLVLRRITQGSFKMCGSYDVTLTKPFYIGIFEMTQKQWTLVYGTKRCGYEWDGDKRPVEGCCSYNSIRGRWDGAKWPSSSAVDSSSFMGMLRARTGLDFDLPTEAQWEYACRAGTTGNYNNGNDLKKLGRYWGNSGDRDDGKGVAARSSAHTYVGSYLSNAWGLFDMHGNVDEWCLDWLGDLSNGCTDPKGATSGDRRVARGGHWDSTADGCTSGYRGSYPPTYGNYITGFRIARTLPRVDDGGDLCVGTSIQAIVDLSSGTRTAATSETIRYSTSYSTMDGCAWIHSVCAPSAWEPSHNNVLRGIEVKHDGTRYVETDRVSASDPLSRLSDGVVNPAGKSYGNTIGLKDGTLTWTLSEPMNISRLRVNTHWQDGGRDGISFIRVEYLQNGSETWTVLPNSAIKVGLLDNSSGPDLEAVYESATGAIVALDATKLRFVLGEQDNSGGGYTEFEAIGVPVSSCRAVVTAYQVESNDLNLDSIDLDAESGMEVDAVLVNDAGTGSVDWTPAKNGTYLLAHRVMSNGEQVGELLTAIFVVDHFPAYTATQTTDVPVPYTWLTQYNPGLSDEYDAYEDAANATAANGRPVWECYVAGLDPTNAASIFSAAISMTNGVPYITWSPNLNTNGIVRKYTILGKESLTDTADWASTNSTHRFFKVKVEMP